MKRTARTALTLTLPLTSTHALAQAQSYAGHHGPMGDWSWGWGGMILGPIMMLVFLAATVAVVVLVIRWLGGNPADPAGPDKSQKPLDILKERYARGEIDTDEFETRKRALLE
ncbi:MAG: SHOCT domain-containing protein [Gammaproteobacteria bacterium]|nr:SHOCT domain-containing protein [Gammaproteobacteria bacterium]